MKRKKLFRYAQALNFATSFSKIYSEIYNSQIKILESLNSSTTRTKDELRIFYEEAKSAYPDWFENYSFDAYLNYLVLNLMIVIHPDNIVSITKIGQDFLKYIIDSKWVLGFELGGRFTSTDFLDGFSPLTSNFNDVYYFTVLNLIYKIKTDRRGFPILFPGRR